MIPETDDKNDVKYGDNNERAEEKLPNLCLFYNLLLSERLRKKIAARIIPFKRRAQMPPYLTLTGF
jgi:hypothetical protein